MNEIEMFFKSIRDFFTAPILKLALYPFFATIIIMYLVFFVVADAGLDVVKEHILQVQEHQVAIDNGEVIGSSTTTQTYFGKDIVEYLLQFTITSWVITFFVYTVGSIFVMMFSTFTTVIIVGFLTPWILDIVRKYHYPELEFKGYGNIANTLWMLTKSFLGMLVLFIILAPLYFIPILNLFVFSIPVYYFFYKALNFDVTSTIMTKEEEAIIRFKSGNKFHIKTMILYIISMIPFIVLFTTVFYIIYLGHGYLYELKKLRENNSKKNSDILDYQTVLTK